VLDIFASIVSIVLARIVQLDRLSLFGDRDPAAFILQFDTPVEPDLFEFSEEFVQCFAHGFTFKT
jgi:hypothetical protein